MTDTMNPRPGDSLGIGGIIGDSFSLTFKNFFGMLALIILPLVVMAGSGYLLLGDFFIASMVDPLAAQTAMADPGFLVKYILWIVLMVLAFSFFYAGAIKLIFDAKSGGRGSIGAAISAGLSGMTRLFVMSLVLGIVVSVVFGILGGVVGALIAAVQAPALGIIFGILVAVGVLWLYGLIAPFGAIVVVEKMWFGAIGRSFALTKGYRWPIVGCIVVFFLALIVVYLGIVLVGYVATLLGTIGIVLMVILGLVGSIVIYGSGVAVFTLIYLRLREIKEGTSIRSLADVFS